MMLSNAIGQARPKIQEALEVFSGYQYLWEGDRYESVKVGCCNSYTLVCVSILSPMAGVILLKLEVFFGFQSASTCGKETEVGC